MPTLRPEHLIGWEKRLQDFLRPMLSFSTASLYFPSQPGTKSHDQVQSSHEQALLDQDLLLIPLRHAGKRLGMLRLSGVDPVQAQALAPFLPHMLSPCLDTIDLELKMKHDPLTGVLREEIFLEQISQQIQELAGFLQPGLGLVEDPGKRPDFALLVVDITHMSALNRQAGHVFGDQVLARTARALQKICNGHSLISRIQGDSFALLLPGVGPRGIIARAEQILQAVRDLRFSHPVNGTNIKLEISAGGVNFPQDVDGAFLQTEAYEQSKRLLSTARECQKRALRLASPELLTPAAVLAKGGRIKDIISSSRVRIDLGSLHQARTGHHFQVFPGQDDDPDAMPRAELRLIQVQETTSLAEVLIPPAGDGNVSPEDRLRLIENPAEYALHPEGREVVSTGEDSLQLISSPDDFFHRWSAACSQDSRFTLSLISLSPHSLQSAVRTIQNLAQDLPKDCLLTRYGLGSLLLYIPGHSPESTSVFLHNFLALLPRDAEKEAAAGIGFYPCLDFTRGETLGLAKQALEHARLLPHPGLTCFDSTTLTLNGDRAFARNDLRQAMHAYSQALLMDEKNSLARNSLAICLAQVGEFNQACTNFRRILELDAKNYMAHYNYGYVCLKLHDREQARACFHRCLELMPGHSYSLLRLGQMAEEDGDLEQAENYCLQAAEAAPAQGTPYRVLGRLACKAGNHDQARRYLHQALVASPQDPEALRLLARLTLEQGDDPEVAESLVRRSLGLQPGHPESLQLLDWAVGEREE
ncbi:MAG: diguanylate cyclase domain-containing protein [Desulfovermiculus sp.]